MAAKKYGQRTLAPIPFTKEGYERVKREYEALQEQRKPAVEKVRIAREMGDLSENAAYHAARQNLFAIDRQLRHLKMQIVYGRVDESARDDQVALGSTVIVKDKSGTKTFTIVGEYEADPVHNKVSIHSPIGKALLGRSVGDRVTVAIPSGTVVYTIASIRQ